MNSYSKLYQSHLYYSMSFLNIQNKYTNVIMYSLLVKHYHIKLTSLVIYVGYRYIGFKI
ncbi:hypothetical protein BN1318_330003 [Staphylococcus capitis]|nr:hypothetical protein BN1318_330003 [Staphylococcus capitis]